MVCCCLQDRDLIRVCKLVCVVWCHAGRSLEVFSKTRGSKLKAVLEDLGGLVRGSSGSRGQRAAQCRSRGGLLSVALLPWKIKGFFLFVVVFFFF